MSDQAPISEGFWAVVELMAHQKAAGFLTERTIAGASFIQVDVPKPDGSTDYTRIYSPAAIYAINPCDRQIAIGIAANANRPVTAYDVAALARDKKQVGWPEDDEEET